MQEVKRPRRIGPDHKPSPAITITVEKLFGHFKK